MSNLTDRLRGIVSTVPRVIRDDGTGGVARERQGFSLGRGEIARAADILAGQMIERAEGALIVVDRFYTADRLHGRERIGSLVETLGSGDDAFETLLRAWPSASANASAFAKASGLLFLDLETTGLAGGAGTYAFLVGCAVVEDDGLRVRQFLLPGFEHERALLAEVSEWTRDTEMLVTFNGRSFDAPLLETRFLYHRLPFVLDERPHVDMLHASRRFWKQRPTIAGPPLDDDSCKLSVLERHLAGVHRIGDVPGFEIPSRFFRFVRDGDAFPLEAVLEHNRIDLVSLALITACAIRLIEQGSAVATHPRECLGLGRVYERAGRAEEAETCFAHAADLAARIGRELDVHAEALRRLALCRRRNGRLREAADAWQQLVTMAGCPSMLRREAREALAIYHEHRVRDLATARLFVLDALAETPDARWQPRAEYRLRRLERKIEARQLRLT